MAIRFECECGKKLSAPDEQAGERVRCPGCGKPVAVPGRSVAATKLDSKTPDIRGPLPLTGSLSEFLKKSVGEIPTVVLKRHQDDLAGVRELIAGPEALDRLGRYPALGSLGRGGMGEVLLVRDPEIGRELAAKVILGGTLADRKALEKFLVEAQVTGQLEHPNIVPVHELDIAPDGRLYFTMKRVRGKDLDKVLSDRKAEVGRQKAEVKNSHNGPGGGPASRCLRPERQEKRSTRSSGSSRAS
ncbi:MAG: hypothetical protein HY720_13655 [Planctomycetes bacterium]|nr:hypothetical protein [Planctomycetota bacterium]